MNKALMRAAAVGLALLLAGFGAAAAEYRAEYKLSSVLSEDFPWGQGGRRWAELIAEKTAGRITVKMYPGASLVGGDQTREFTALRQGIIDLAVGSTINWSPQVKELILFSLPFLMPDHRAFDALVGGGVGRDLFAALEAKGVVPLAWGENGFRELSNARRPIAVPADLAGLRIRIVGSPVFADTMSALGASPVQLTWADAGPALATGAVDGQENPLSIFRAARLGAFSQKYLTLWGYVADPLIFVVNQRVWDGWSPEDQAAVRAAAEQAAAEQIVMARRTATLDDIAAGGVAVTRLSPEQKAAFQAATRPVYDKWAKVVGERLVKAAEEAVEKR